MLQVFLFGPVSWIIIAHIKKLPPEGDYTTKIDKQKGGDYVIQIKTYFNGWHEVSKETALKFARGLYEGIMTMNNKEKVTYINCNKLRGIAFTEEQLKGGKNEK